jgi:hypothetical protein
MNHSFGISEEDIESVLSKHWARVANSDGKSFEDMAGDLFAHLDAGAIERAALKGGVDLDDQTEAAYEEIERQLVARGVLSEVRPTPARKARP